MHGENPKIVCTLYIFLFLPIHFTCPVHPVLGGAVLPTVINYWYVSWIIWKFFENRTTASVSLLIHSYHHPFKFTLCTNKLSIPKLIFALLQFLNFYASVPMLYPYLRNLKKISYMPLSVEFPASIITLHVVPSCLNGYVRN